MQHGRFSWMLIVTAGLLLLFGCDTTLNPFAEETGQFSVYGYLTLSDKPSFIRVKDLNDPLVTDSTRTLDATVTLENLATGTTETLTDSIVVFEGIYTHNFRADQQIQPATPYRLTVERSDGRAVQATATMPERTNVEVQPTGPVGCTQNIRVAFPNVPAPRFVRVAVGLPWRERPRWVNLDAPSSNGIPVSNFVPATVIREVIPENILMTIGPPEQYCTLLDGPVRIAYTHFGPNWPADSVLADPFASNIKQGLGVFGGLHRDTLLKAANPTD